MDPDITATPEIYQSPGLLYVLCTMSAMAFVISCYRWFAHVADAAKKGQEFNHTYSMYIWRGQMLNFIFVMLISVSIGLFDFISDGEIPSIWGESLFLLLFLSALYWHAKKENRMKEMFKTLAEVLWLGLLCFAGWAVTLFIGMVMAEMLKMSVHINREDTEMLTVFFPGLLWLVPVYFFYQKTLWDADRRKALKGRRFGNFIWPILFAYIIVAFPIVTQEIVNSDQWHKMKNATIIKKA